ncbi:hypothetical protein I350_03391 [Cryptococcus amylolentus CBS 6273]|uniref:Uncharacterized protein n=1 Tax=Cryptococcus amylolentus CBS 6273 TaxID=1296118 RepID=A0A1E3K6G7_9TREE|nr:hypothetical protein I350_03391 [Cryptococcus amylolentus CBS 6273]
MDDQPYANGDYVPNDTEIHVDAHTHPAVALTYDLDAKPGPTDMIVDDETLHNSHQYANGLKNDDIPIDPALQSESEDEKNKRDEKEERDERDNREGRDEWEDREEGSEDVPGAVIGRKRKAEDDLGDGEDEKEEHEQEQEDGIVEGDENNDEIEDEDGVADANDAKEEPVRDLVLGVEAVEEKYDKAESEMAADDEYKGSRGQAPKRAPRKKRKWLRKGEGKFWLFHFAKHRLIDEALVNLDQQEKELLNGSHPQLLLLWQEVARRKDAQLDWVEAREEAAVREVTKMRDHWRDSAITNFHVEMEKIQDDMTHANRFMIARLAGERVALRRNPDALPNLRAGRGGGGWALANKHLLSKDEQPLVSFEADGQTRQRRSVPKDITVLSHADARSDLVKMGVQTRSSAHRSPSPPSRRHTSEYPVHHGRSAPAKRPPPQAQTAPWPQHRDRYQPPPPPPILPPQTHNGGMWDRPSSMYHHTLPPPPQPSSYNARAAHDYEAGLRRDPPSQNSRAHGSVSLLATTSSRWTGGLKFRSTQGRAATNGVLFGIPADYSTPASAWHGAPTTD